MMRRLHVVADDYGMGPGTSRGILALGREGIVSGTVLLTNTLYAEAAVRDWERAGRPLELGWHPALTLDGPLSAPDDVPSLLDERGRFLPLGKFLARLFRGGIRPAECRRELQAQLDRFRALVGSDPTLVNGHHHIHIFPAIGPALRDVLAGCRVKPYVRRVAEPWRVWATVPGSRRKRAFLYAFGRRAARAQARAGFPGADCLVGITTPERRDDPAYWSRWFAAAPGRTVELICHPGEYDDTLVDRDAGPDDLWLKWRVRELKQLRTPEFAAAVRAAGFAATRAA